MKEVVLVGGLRTPFAKAGTVFKELHATDLGTQVLRELVLRHNLSKNLVDEVIIGNVGNPSDAANISRVVALRAGLPESISSRTVHRNCASALESVSSAYDSIRSGSNEVVIAGGVESMSQYPLLYSQKFSDFFVQLISAKKITKRLKTLFQFKLKYLKPRIAMLEGLSDPFVGLSMGQTAEVLAKEFHISRSEQDEFALQSHKKAVGSRQSLAEEIDPVFSKGFKKIVEYDNGPRENQTLQALKKLKPYFDRKYGTVTVGNACPITDGAAMLLIMSKEKALSLGYKPLAYIHEYAFAGLDPKRMGLGPVFATHKLFKRLNGMEGRPLGLKEIDRIELNEAFAAQVLSCAKAFESQEFSKKHFNQQEALGELCLDKVNVNGGAIALGHPVGATGSRLVLSLALEMKRSSVQWGLATLCIGGGQGGALLLENASQ